MIPRRLRQAVRSSLDRSPAVAILGPRQVGKTTLAREIAAERPSIYLDLEQPEDRAKLTDPALFLSQVEDRLVVMDEIHRVPELFASLRGIIDDGRTRGLRFGRFLILGSASMDLLRQSSESLAGRIAYAELNPIGVLEVPPEVHDRLWLRGGFPESLLAPSDELSVEWRRDFVRTYLDRDIPILGPRIPSETLRRFWTMLAHLQGTPLNAAQLARNLGVDWSTVTRYLDLMVDLLLVRRLAPWHRNSGKRLIKSPKIYLRDSGLLHALLGIGTLEHLMGHPVVGASWEGLVIETLVDFAGYQAFASHYRSAGGAEVDLILEIPGRGTWAIEVKRSLDPRPGRGFHSACEEIQPDRAIVVYPGSLTYPLSSSVTAIPLGVLAQELAGTA